MRLIVTACLGGLVSYLFGQLATDGASFLAGMAAGSICMFMGFVSAS